MASLDPLNIDFDIEAIFHRCIKEYKDVKGNIVEPDTNLFNNVCIFINNKLKSNSNIFDFHRSCIYLSNYLKYIKEKSEEDRVPYCKYFNFMLKGELNRLQLKCKGEVACYEEMISTWEGSTKNNYVPDICKGHIQDLDPRTFSLFQKLENLHYNQYDKLSVNKGCPQGSICFNNYKELCYICQNINNEGLRSLLKNFKEELLQNVFDAPSCIKPTKNLLSSSIRTVLLTSLIITLTIPHIALILYEYTPCGLYLQPIIRKLNEIWNKKRKQEQQLINSSKNTYDELVDKWSPISYSAIDFN